MGQLNFDVQRIVAETAVKVVAGVDDTTEAGRVYAASISHVRTGFWQSQWYIVAATIQGNHVVGSLRNDTPYGGYHNFGTSKYPGAHTLEATIDAIFPSAGSRIASRL